MPDSLTPPQRLPVAGLSPSAVRIGVALFALALVVAATWSPVAAIVIGVVGLGSALAWFVVRTSNDGPARNVCAHCGESRLTIGGLVVGACPHCGTT